MAISHHHISAISHHHISAISHHHISASSRPKIPQNSDTYQRRIADFAVASSISMPAKWHLSRDNFLTGKGSITEELSVKHERKLKEARQVLEKIGPDTSEGLVMIDTLQRLGIDYHFQNEIEAVLQSQYMNPGSFSHPEGNLYDVSTRFRLLRQEGYYVPTDVFNNFKDKEGRFRSELGADIRGLMGLYEASQLSTEGEDILVQAADFSSELLNGGIRNLDHYEARVVRWTLQYPHHKSASRFMVQSFLGEFKGANGWANVLHELAKLDFNMTQSTYQNEILRVNKWWKDMGLAKELRHARDQPLKWHMWSMAALTNQSNSEERVELTKPISFIYLIDDIFDVYGTLDELTLFTEAVNRWDLAAAEKLPHYIKICFKALDEVTNGIAYKVYRKHGWNPIDSLRKTWARLCNAFLVEAKWFASGQLPKAEEYLKNGIISSGVHVALVHMFYLLGHDINKHSVNLVDDNPGIMTSTAAILRLWDDLGSAKDELQDGRDGSYVVCYMEDRRGTSVESARKQVMQMISDSWKRLNRECLRPNPYSATFTKGCLNMARMVSLMYSYDDNQRLPILEDHMKSILSGSVSF